jgi:hypothetical protein
MIGRDPSKDRMRRRCAVSLAAHHFVTARSRRHIVFRDGDENFLVSVRR